MTEKREKTWRILTKERAWMTAAVLLIIGCLLRVLFLEALPYGLNQDEASTGYDAWALLHSGIDRSGKSWPILFLSWGSGQNALLSYLSIPWIAMLGLRPLSIRIPNAIFGCITLYFMWKLACRCRGERFGLCALFLLVINPWHIMASRWGLESNLLPALLWGACWFLSLAEEKSKALLGSAICLGLAPYAYGTVFFLLPPFLVWSAIRLRKLWRNKWVWISLLIFIVLILPIALCQANNILGGEEFNILGVTFPRLTDVRQNATSVLGGGGFSAIRKNISVFLEILHNGDDGVEYNTMPFWQGGIFYFFGLPLAVLGIIVSLQERRKHSAEWPVRAMLFCSIACAALISGNINRLNMVWLPMIYFSALGGTWLIRHLQVGKAIPLATAFLCFCYFLFSYASGFTPPGNEKYFPGLGDAIHAAKETDPDTIYITPMARQPYIFALFYTTPAPEEFYASAEYVDYDGVMLTVERFAGFEFADPDRADVLILSRGDEKAEGRELLGEYGCFMVCR